MAERFAVASQAPHDQYFAILHSGVDDGTVEGVGRFRIVLAPDPPNAESDDRFTPKPAVANAEGLAK